MKKMHFLTSTFLFLLLTSFLLSFAKTTTNPPPPTGNPEGNGTGVIANGVLGRDDPEDVYIQTCAVFGQNNYVVFNHDISLTYDPNQFPYLALTFYLTDPNGNPLSGNFLGQVNDSFTVAFNPVIPFPTIPSTTVCDSFECIIQFNLYYSCMIPSTYPVDDEIHIHMYLFDYRHTPDGEFTIFAPICSLVPFGDRIKTAGRLGGPGSPQTDAFDNFYDLYPNPFQDHVTLSANPNGRTQFSLWNLQGHMLRKSDWVEANMSQQWNLAQLPPGVYIVMIEDEFGQRGVRKMIKK